MKIRFFIASSILVAANVADHRALAQGPAAEAPIADPVAALRGVDARVDKAAFTALSDRAFEAFDQIESDLRNLDTRGAAALEHYRNYWLAYTLYQRSLAHLRLQDMAATERALSAANVALAKSDVDDGEVDTLLSLITGLQLMFVPPQDVVRDAQISQRHLEAGMRKGPTIRTHYALAIADWNTPPEYGGRTKAEAALREGLRLEAEGGARLKPSWGRDAAEALLLQILYATSRAEEADSRLKSALETYPNSVALRDIVRMKEAR